MSDASKIIIWIIIIIVVAAGIWYGLSKKPAVAPEGTQGPIRIGGLAPLTGDAVAYGIPLQRIADMTAAEINAAGGVNGRELKIIWEDGKCNGQDAATAVSKLINIDKVKVILGGVCSAEVLGAAPIANTNQVVMFSSGATSPKVTEAGDFIFRDTPSDLTQGKIVAEAAWNDLGYKKVAVIQEITDYALGVRQAFEKRFTELGGAVVTETFTSEVNDVRGQLTKLKGAGADALLVSVQTLPKGLLVIKQIAELNMGLPLLLNDITIDYQEIIANYPETVEGAIGAKIALPNPGLFEEKVGRQYREKYGEEPPLPEYMGLTYDAVYILKEAIENSLSEKGEINSIKVRDYLYSVKDRPGIGGTLTIDQNGDPVAGHILKQIKDGKVVNYSK